jgi:hypothetical protein
MRRLKKAQEKCLAEMHTWVPNGRRYRHRPPGHPHNFSGYVGAQQVDLAVVVMDPLSKLHPEQPRADPDKLHEVR